MSMSEANERMLDSGQNVIIVDLKGGNGALVTTTDASDVLTHSPHITDILIGNVNARKYLYRYTKQQGFSAQIIPDTLKIEA